MPKQSQKIGRTKDGAADELEETELSSLLASINDPRIRKVVTEYWDLSLSISCEDSDDDRLESILAEAEKDSHLNFFLLEVNHILGHKQGCLDEDCRKSYDESKIILAKELDLLKQKINSTSCSSVEQTLEQYLSSRKTALSQLSKNAKPVRGKS